MAKSPVPDVKYFASKSEISIQNNFFLIDSGADVSVLPLTSKSCDIRPTAVTLFAAKGSAIKVIGERRIKLNLGLGRDFYWSFVIADVTSPIIGSDFIKHHDLLIDLRRNRLVDNTTRTSSDLKSATYNEAASIRTFDPTNPFTVLLRQFHDITQLAPYGSTTKSSIVHRIETTGQQHVFCRPRRLCPEKLAAAKIF